LHLRGQLIAGDARGQVVFARASLEMLAVEAFEDRQIALLGLG
jgi:hypothetical protein